jgi:hypothetical protein
MVLRIRLRNSYGPSLSGAATESLKKTQRHSGTAASSGLDLSTILSVHKNGVRSLLASEHFIDWQSLRYGREDNHYKPDLS